MGVAATCCHLITINSRGGIHCLISWYQHTRTTVQFQYSSSHLEQVSTTLVWSKGHFDAWVSIQDMGELEAGVGQSVYPLDHLGLPFNMLRAFRQLLFLDTAEVMGSPLVRELPASVVLHHLYSRAPAELQSPHVRQSFTPAQVNTTAGFTLPRSTLVPVLPCNFSS